MLATLYLYPHFLKKKSWMYRDRPITCFVYRSLLDVIKLSSRRYRYKYNIPFYKGNQIDRVEDNLVNLIDKYRM